MAPRIELPEGYSINHRLGAGGYGEVWQATAPGGVEKAIKIVFGHCDEDLAGRELKSLDRIKGVRHPFVLSIERYDIVAGRLIIVTELADMSLDACFKRHQEQERPGIPRDELLGYISDAAEGLDCLVIRHSLQHLDIKPENLLLVGDHVKVADFGLVKELATRTINSMMGGMTPLYSAPEIYDDDPSPRSDQYSLAIVYQQMLTGALPFPGRTPAQLAKQHTQAEPNLQSLCEHDRKVVGRALAKDPAARFESCCDFVAALRGETVTSSPNTSVPTTTSSATQPRQLSGDDTKSMARQHTEPLQPVTAAQATQALPGKDTARPRPVASEPIPKPLPALEFPTVDSAIHDLGPTADETELNESQIPTLFVAVGGVGVEMLTCIRSRTEQVLADNLKLPDLAWLAIDTDRESLENAATADEGAGKLDSGDTLLISLRRPKQYRDSSQELLRWVSRRWLYNIPRSLQTRGYRPLGRIALVDHAGVVLRSLHQRLAQLTQGGSFHADQPQQVRVVVLTGMSGGTGGGTAIDVAQAVRSLAKEMNLSIDVTALLAGTLSRQGIADSLAAANMYALLTELSHAQRQGNSGASTPVGPASRFESRNRPFDEIYCVNLPSRLERRERELALNSIAEYSCLRAFIKLDGVSLPSSDSSGEASDSKSWKTFRLVPTDRLREGVGTSSSPLSLSTMDDRLLDCGYNRRTFLLHPTGTEQSALEKEVVELRPTTNLVAANVSRSYLLSEGSQLNTLHLAARLAEFVPDVDEAASRLHTRDDIPWNDLRRES